MTISNKKILNLYRELIYLRRCELKIAELYKEQEMRTPAHFGVGQEAIAAGVCAALNIDDVVYSHHRCHNHYLAKNGDLVGLIAELYGREDGCSRGRGGSVHLTDVDSGFIASTAIVGQTVAVATGAALAFKMDKEKKIAVSFFGDAVLEEGIFYESINYAAINKLPVLYVCENNLYSTETKSDVRQPENTSFLDRVKAYGIKSVCLDGNNASTVYEETMNAVNNMRDVGGPFFMECRTYRWLEHVGPNYDYELNRNYRTKEELDAWIKKCPVALLEKEIIDDEIADKDFLESILKEVNGEIDCAIEKAKKSSWPETSTLFDNI